jgi:D-glycero-alpha-D-manno-heptose-7-phosphate kinase
MLHYDTTNFTLPNSSSAYDALAKIEGNATGTVLVIEAESNKVLGVVTDGDIRKHLLDHRMLTAPVVHLMNQFFVYAQSSEEQDLREIFSINPYVRLLPVIDSDNKLVAVATPYPIRTSVVSKY